ncbi:DNA-directed RNA polymerase I subunit RPA12-like [Corticium candelabrum]|uniref:DNA-directed RNA polymerase I subunit RPA12-like n=1 Tax=Corticium candelabrum TaxID=121492 RepID=UPI002E258E2E|nr:DNA-directed RNA polymerase I subunit RPA12-like [Corticium candelabrum]
MAKVSFSCDASFCPHCGTLLPLPGISDVVTCLLCSYKINASVFEGVEEYSCKTYATKVTSKKEKTELDGPLAEKVCPNCGNKRMVYHTLQTRSADEGQTVFYKCPKCKFQETELS